MNDLIFWLQPFIAAFIGWGAIRVAVYTLFRPGAPLHVLGITIQGLLPKKQKQVAEKLGTLTNDFIDFEKISATFTNHDLLKELNPMIENHLDHFLAVKLKEKLPVLSMYIGESTMATIKEGMMEEIELLLPEIISRYADALGKKINIEQMVAEKISGFSAGRLEQMLRSELKKEFRSAGLMGAGLGFIIGMIQMCLSLLLS